MNTVIQLSQDDPEWIVFDWLDFITMPWEPGVLVSAGLIRRPTVAMGYLAECTQAGMTSAREPSWPSTGTVADGSAIWTMRAPGDASLVTVASAQYTLTPSGIAQAATGLLVPQSRTRVRLDASAAAPGFYELVAEMTDSAGEDHEQRVTIEVLA